MLIIRAIVRPCHNIARNWQEQCNVTCVWNLAEQPAILFIQRKNQAVHLHSSTRNQNQHHWALHSATMICRLTKPKIIDLLSVITNYCELIYHILLITLLLFKESLTFYRAYWTEPSITFQREVICELNLGFFKRTESKLYHGVSNNESGYPLLRIGTELCNWSKCTSLVSKELVELLLILCVFILAGYYRASALPLDSFHGRLLNLPRPPFPPLPMP